MTTTNTEQAPETSTEADEAAVLCVLVEKALIAGQHVSQESLIGHFAFAEKPPRSRATVETAMQQLAESGAVELGGRPPACSLTLAGLLQSPYGDEAREIISSIIAALRERSATPG
jgi:DNA-binding transcriptional MocR family regulator